MYRKIWQWNGSVVRPRFRPVKLVRHVLEFVGVGQTIGGAGTPFPPHPQTIIRVALLLAEPYHRRMHGERKNEGRQKTAQ